MNTVIGIFSSEEQLNSSVNRLKEHGLSEKQIKIFTCKDEICQYLDKYCPCHLVGGWTLLGLFLGIVLFGALGFVASFINFRIWGFSVALWGSVFLVLTALGAITGGLVGYMFGTDAWQKEKRVYLKGAQAGDKVIAIPVADEQTAVNVEVLLQQDKAKGVERLSHMPEAAFEGLVESPQANAPAATHA